MKRKNWYWIVATLAILVIVVLVLVKNKGNGRFALNEEASLKTALGSERTISPDALQKLRQSNPDQLRIIDIRSPADFAQSHLDGAINIPTQHLLDEEYQRMFHKKDLRFVLCSQEESEANGPWMLLLQTGVADVRILQGGMQQAGGGQPLLAAETARFDYAKAFQEAVDKEKASTAPPKVIVAAPAASAPKRVVPKKKAAVEEEEEGC